MKRNESVLVAMALSLVISTVSIGQESPYLDIADRSLKSLSSQQIDDLLAGRGMGRALAAELNGYPGPKHVLELAEELDLSSEQEAAMRSVFHSMHGEAVGLGLATRTQRCVGKRDDARGIRRGLAVPDQEE